MIWIVDWILKCKKLNVDRLFEMFSGFPQMLQYDFPRKFTQLSSIHSEFSTLVIQRAKTILSRLADISNFQKFIKRKFNLENSQTGPTIWEWSVFSEHPTLILNLKKLKKSPSRPHLSLNVVCTILCEIICENKLIVQNC